MCWNYHFELSCLLYKRENDKKKVWERKRAKSREKRFFLVSKRCSRLMNDMKRSSYFIMAFPTEHRDNVEIKKTDTWQSGKWGSWKKWIVSILIDEEGVTRERERKEKPREDEKCHFKPPKGGNNIYVEKLTKKYQILAYSTFRIK